MIALDTNLLVYAHRRDSEWHAAAERVVRNALEANAVAIPWPCIHEFLAIVTHPRIFRTPTSVAAALDQVDAWLESPHVVCLSEADEYWAVLRAFVQEGRISGPRVHDARIAALCRAHGVRELWSSDRDFSAFPSLTVRNPIVPRR